MSEVRFYHLTRSTLEAALPPILEKVIERGWRAVVRTSTPERAEALSDSLWTAKEDSFLPHGTQRDGHAARQPVWITDTDENPNNANTVILADGVMETNQAADLVCLLFDGHDADVVTASRAAWKKFQDAGHSLTYWQQTDKGWEKKN